MSRLMPLTESSKTFLERNPVDARAEQRLGNMDEELQARVCTSDLKPDVRNPSAYLSKRCREVEREAHAQNSAAERPDSTAAAAECADTAGTDQIHFEPGMQLWAPAISVPAESYREIAEHFGVMCEDLPAADEVTGDAAADGTAADDGEDGYDGGQYEGGEWPDEGEWPDPDEEWPDEGDW